MNGCRIRASAEYSHAQYQLQVVEELGALPTETGAPRGAPVTGDRLGIPRIRRETGGALVTASRPAGDACVGPKPFSGSEIHARTQ